MPHDEPAGSSTAGKGERASGSGEPASQPTRSSGAERTRSLGGVGGSVANPRCPRWLRAALGGRHFVGGRWRRAESGGGGTVAAEVRLGARGGGCSPRPRTLARASSCRAASAGRESGCLRRRAASVLWGARDLQPRRRSPPSTRRRRRVPSPGPTPAEARERRGRGCLRWRDGPAFCAGLGRARQPAVPGVRAAGGAGRAWQGHRALPKKKTCAVVSGL